MTNPPPLFPFNSISTNILTKEEKKALRQVSGFALKQYGLAPV